MFKEFLNKIDFSLSKKQSSQLNEFCNLLLKWNKAYNLTAITKTEDIINKHIIDSLMITKYVDFDPNNWLDVGSGAGIPGIILAIYYPDIKFTLLDSNGKKTRFMYQAQFQLKLNNAIIIKERIENLKNETFDIISSRAFSKLNLFLNITKHLANENTKFISLKSNLVHKEIEEVENFKILNNYQYNLPNQNSRNLIIAIQEK